MVSSITYNHETDMLTVVQPFGTNFLGQKTVEFHPKELERISDKKMNLLLDRSCVHQSIRKGEQRQNLGTEYDEAVWYDRKFFETIISQPGERYQNMPITQKNIKGRLSGDMKYYNYRP